MGIRDLCRVPQAIFRDGTVLGCRGVVGIVVPFVQRGLFGDNSFYRAPGGKWTQETCVGCPQQRHATEEPGKVQGRDRVGIVEGPCVYLARGSVFGEISSYGETRSTRLAGSTCG